MALELTIVTADKRIHFDQLHQVVFSSPHGQVGILAGHEPLVSQVTGGVLKVFSGGEGRSLLGPDRPLLFAVARGLARVVNDQVTLLVADALAEAEIDPERAEERWREETALIAARHVPFSPIEREDLEEATEFTTAQLEVVEIVRREQRGRGSA